MKIKYFKGRVSRGFFSIFATRIVLRISMGLLGMFLPIFLYNFFNENIFLVFAYYFVGYFLYASSIAIACQFLNKIGLRLSLRISVVIGAVYYLFLYFLDIFSRIEVFSLQNKTLLWLIVLIIVTQVIQRSLYWVPLNTDMAKFTNKTNRARQVSLLEAATLVLGAVTPLISGIILTYYQYDALFSIALVIYLIALIPLMFLPRTREKYTWTYKKTWKEFFSKERRGAMLAYAGDGAEAVVGAVIWPIFIFELLDGNYFEVGALSSLIVIFTIILQLMIGGYADKGSKKKMLHWGSALYALGWIIKIFIVTAFHIFIVSAYHNLMKIIARTPFNALSYEKAADEGHYVDEYTALHEMAVNYGKTAMIVLSSILVCFFSLEWTFILAALASLVMNFITQTQVKKTGRKSI